MQSTSEADDVPGVSGEKQNIRDCSQSTLYHSWNYVRINATGLPLLLIGLKGVYMRKNYLLFMPSLITRNGEPVR